MSGEHKPSMADPPHKMSTTDAIILGGAIVGILIGVSLLSYEAAVAVGVLALAFSIYKLFTTKP